MDPISLNWTDLAVLAGTLLTSIGGASFAGGRAGQQKAGSGCAGLDKRLTFLEANVPDRDHKIREDFNLPLGLHANKIIALETKMDRGELDIRTVRSEFTQEIRRLEGIIDVNFRELNKKLDNWHFNRDPN